MSTMQEKVEYVKAHALEHYEDGGWDVIVEAWSDEDLSETIRVYDCKSRKQAVKAVGEVVGVYADRQAAARQEEC